jgi:predicted deacetylase
MHPGSTRNPPADRDHRSAAPAGAKGCIAVAIHDVEPATFERCALIRDWLDDHGIERVTLLVIPAPDLHPFFQRRPDLAAWLLDCRDRGDAIAQHGFQHCRERPAEFAGMDAVATRASIAAGRRVLSLAGVEPRGFVAPAYAYTPALRRELATGFDWWATLLRLVGRERAAMAPALGLRASALSPLALRAGAFAAGRLLRLDLHPADFDRPRHVLALESVLSGAARRTAVTYDDLCSGP